MVSASVFGLLEEGLTRGHRSRSIFPSLSQPISVVLPFGFGVAVGAMIPLVLTEALAIGGELPRGWRAELAAGTAVDVLIMVPLALV